MTQASVTRIEKKLNKKKPTTNMPHQTKSFDQLVADTTLERLKPYIQQQVGMAGQQILNSIYQTLMQERAMMQTRQLAFERLLRANTTWFNDEVLSLAVADVEDESAGLSGVTGPIVEGDKVRLEFSAQPSNAAEPSQMSKLAVHSVMRKNPNGTVQTHEDLEKNLVGLSAGETKEFLIAEPAEEGKEPENTRIKVTVIKVSRAPAPKPVAEGGQSEQAPNA